MDLLYTIFGYVSALLATITVFALIIRGLKIMQKAEEQELIRQLKEAVERIS